MARAFGIHGLNEETATLVSEAVKQGWSVMPTSNGRLWWTPPIESEISPRVVTGKQLHTRDVAKLRGSIARTATPQLVQTARAVKEMHQPQVKEVMTRGQKGAATRAANRASHVVPFDHEVYETALRNPRVHGKQKELASWIGVSQSTLSGWKTGSNPIVLKPAREAWAKVEELAMEWLAMQEEVGSTHVPVEPKVDIDEKQEPPGPSVASEAAGDPSATLAGDIAAVTELIEELVARRIRGAQERIANLEALLEREQEKCANLRDENERLRSRTAGLQEKMSEVARKAADAAIKEFLR